MLDEYDVGVSLVCHPRFMLTEEQLYSLMSILGNTILYSVQTIVKHLVSWRTPGIFFLVFFNSWKFVDVNVVAQDPAYPYGHSSYSYLRIRLSLSKIPIVLNGLF